MQTGEGIFFALWLVLAGLTLASWLFFWRNRDAQLKRKIWRLGTAISGTIFVLFVLLASWPHVQIVFFMLPVVALITWLNLRNTKFCDQCGATLFNHNWFSTIRYCPHCGATLTE